MKINPLHPSWNRLKYILQYFYYLYSMINYLQYIEIDPKKRFGRPILKGTRISVYDVLNWLANGMSKKQISSDFPELSEEMVNACLFYAANKENHLRIASWNCFLTKIFFRTSLRDLTLRSGRSNPTENCWEIASGTKRAIAMTAKKEFYSWK